MPPKATSHIKIQSDNWFPFLFQVKKKKSAGACLGCSILFQMYVASQGLYE